MGTRIYNVYKVCDNRIETVFRIKKELEPLYERLVFENLDQFGKHTLKHVQGYMKKGYRFWDVINRFVLYGGKRKDLKEGNEKKLNTPLNGMFYWDLQYVLQGYIDMGQNDPLNFEASMVLLEYRGQMYVQFFGFHGHEHLGNIYGGYFKSLLDKGILADRHYQDQTDDEDEDSGDWEDRAGMRDEIYAGGLDGHDTPAQAGFSYEFFSRMPKILHKYSKRRAEEKPKTDEGKIVTVAVTRTPVCSHSRGGKCGRIKVLKGQKPVTCSGKDTDCGVYEAGGSE